MRELSYVDAKVRLVDDFFAQPGEARQLIDDLLPLLRGERVALVQCLRVLSGSPLLRLLPRFIHILRQVRRQFVVVARDRRERRNQKNVRLIVGEVVFQRLEIQDSGKQGDPVERNPLIRQIARNTRRPCSPVAFSQDKQRRSPTFIPADIHPDEFAERLNVPLHAPELLHQFAISSAAVPCPDRIDQHQVALVE